MYAYALGGHTWCIKLTPSAGSGTKARVDNGIPNALALLRVNRQIYAEASLFPLLYNTFAGVHNGHLREWVESLPEVQRRCIRTVKRYQRGYIVKRAGGEGLAVNPVFWMDLPRVAGLGLVGLERVEVEVALQRWTWDTEQEEMNEVVEKAMAKLRGLVEEAHPGIVVHVFSRRGY